MQGVIEAWPPVLQQHLRSTDGRSSRQYAIAVLPCHCAIAAQQRAIKQSRGCLCCGDKRKSQLTKRMTAAIREVVDMHSNSACLFMVEFPFDVGKRAPRRADILLVPMLASEWDQTVVIEIDPPSHYYNADARSHNCNIDSLEGKRDALLDADEKKDQLYAQLGMHHLRVTMGSVWDDVHFQHVAAAVRNSMQRAGI